jgi:hypothetical protein
LRVTQSVFFPALHGIVGVSAVVVVAFHGTVVDGDDPMIVFYVILVIIM